MLRKIFLIRRRGAATDAKQRPGFQPVSHRVALPATPPLAPAPARVRDPRQSRGLEVGAAQSGLPPFILITTTSSPCLTPLILWALSRLTVKLHFGRARLCPSRNFWAHTEVLPPSHYANHPFPHDQMRPLFSLPTQSIAIECSKSQTSRAFPAQPGDLLLDFRGSPCCGRARRG